MEINDDLKVKICVLLAGPSKQFSQGKPTNIVSCNNLVLPIPAFLYDGQKYEDPTKY